MVEKKIDRRIIVEEGEREREKEKNRRERHMSRAERIVNEKKSKERRKAR
jgi:hypothetical protein